MIAADMASQWSPSGAPGPRTAEMAAAEFSTAAVNVSPRMRKASAAGYSGWPVRGAAAVLRRCGRGCQVLVRLSHALIYG